MNITGTISWIGPVQTGTSQRGTNWTKQQFAVEYLPGQYPKSILLDIMDASVCGTLAVGQKVSVDFDCEVRAYKGRDGVDRMFNNFTIWRNGLRFLGAQQPAQQQYQQPAPQQQYQQVPPQQAPQQQYQQPVQPQAQPQQPIQSPMPF